MWVPRGRYLLIYDLVAIPIAVYASFILRLEAWDLGQFTYGGIGFVASATFVIPLFLIGSHSYRQHWAFASVAEFVRLAIAVTSSVALLGLSIFLLGTEVDLFQIPRSVPLIALPTVVGVVAAPRLLLRILLRRRPQPASQGMPRRRVPRCTGTRMFLLLSQCRQRLDHHQHRVEDRQCRLHQHCQR